MLRVSQKVPPTICKVLLIKQKGGVQTQWNAMKDKCESSWHWHQKSLTSNSKWIVEQKIRNYMCKSSVCPEMTIIYNGDDK
jgi:succinate dehydrogenase/fumarate reductase flavoprotein subunit